MLMKNVTSVFHVFAFFPKKGKDSHKKCDLYIGVDEKRNGCLFFVFFYKTRNIHKKGVPGPEPKKQT